MPRWQQLRTALMFAVFEATMPILGVIAGEAAAALVGAKARVAGTVVLALVGLYSLLKRDDPGAAEQAGSQPGEDPLPLDLPRRDGASTLSQGSVQGPLRNRQTRRNRMNTVILAVALSLDNLTVGFGLGMFHVPLALAALVFGIVSLVMTMLGLEIGRYLGAKVTLSADKLSGVVLLLTAGVMILK